MRAWILAAALALIASPAVAQSELAPPTPEDVAVRVSASQNGQAIDAVQGDMIAVELRSSPSAGSSWRIASQPEFLAVPEMLSGPTFAQGAGAPPRVGAPRWQVFVFPVIAAGSGDVVIEKRGPANRDGPPLETFTLTINAQ